MAKLTAQEYAEKHARRLTEALPDMERGIDRVDESPMEKAAAKKDKAVANYAAAADKMVARLKATPLQTWKDRFKAKLSRVGEGIAESRDKVVGFAEVLLPHVEAGQRATKSLPDRTPADMERRMVEFSRHMRKLKYRR